ncbi:MAG TPA: BRCT domain-containing protein [Planctomycetota bacterium]|nr:BRCT domain-containing protein [Planctomycetota bacterium]
MSSRQTLLYSLMIFFFVLMLVALGFWFKSSMELNEKSNLLTVLKDRAIDLDRVLKGTESNKKTGLEYQVNDEQEGLKVLVTQAEALAAKKLDNPDISDPGMKQRVEQYEKLEPEVTKKWKEDAKKAWEELYGNWVKQSDDLNKQLENLRNQKKEKEEKIAAAQADYDQEVQNHETEMKKIAQAKAKNAQELEAVRYEHEETQNKITELTREYSKVKTPVKQGEIISSDTIAKTAVINVGAAQGVRKGMLFEIYSASNRQLVKKGMLEVTDAGPLSSKCMLIEGSRENRWDPVTHWIPTNPEYQYSILAAGGPDDTDAIKLEKRKSVKDRIEGMRLEKIAREQGLEAAENARENAATSSVPPSDLSLQITPVTEGDWIYSPDFIPIVSDKEFRAQNRAELETLRDVNIGPLTFYIADTVRTYRKEYLRRLIERNGCKLSDTMTPNVNVVVTGIGFNRLDLVADRVGGKKGKEGLKDEDKAELSTLAALEDAKKYGADTMPEDEMEAYFDRRVRKQELLRGKLIQPGRSVFFIAGKTRNRTPELLAHYIQDHGGVVATDINGKVDYVVVGEAPEDTFIENIKKRGLKIIREDELPEFFGEKH